MHCVSRSVFLMPARLEWDAGQTANGQVDETQLGEGPAMSLAALLLLISPFFFWGTSMVAMKVMEVLKYKDGHFKHFHATNVFSHACFHMDECASCGSACCRQTHKGRYWSIHCFINLRGILKRRHC